MFQAGEESRWVNYKANYIPARDCVLTFAWRYDLAAGPESICRPLPRVSAYPVGDEAERGQMLKTSMSLNTASPVEIDLFLPEKTIHAFRVDQIFRVAGERPATRQ
jgi:hypothetical protein